MRRLAGDLICNRFPQAMEKSDFFIFRHNYFPYKFLDFLIIRLSDPSLNEPINQDLKYKHAQSNEQILISQRNHYSPVAPETSMIIYIHIQNTQCVGLYV